MHDRHSQSTGGLFGSPWNERSWRSTRSPLQMALSCDLLRGVTGRCLDGFLFCDGLQPGLEVQYDTVCASFVSSRHLIQWFIFLMRSFRKLSPKIRIRKIEMLEYGGTNQTTNSSNKLFYKAFYGDSRPMETIVIQIFSE